MKIFKRLNTLFFGHNHDNDRTHPKEGISMNQYISQFQYVRKRMSLFVFVICVGALLCACQREPQTSAAGSKNDETFSKIIQETTHERHDNITQESVPITVSDTFFSTDKSVEFTFSIDQIVSNHAMPAVEVVPHYLTVEDAQRVASILFGDVEFYEADPLLAPQYTKEEIQESIRRWSYYTNSEAISALLGQNDAFTIERVKAKIEELNLLYESAQDDSSRVPCQWEFHKDSVYTYSPQEAASADTSYDNDAIMATCKIDGIGYRYEVVTRNKMDYKLNIISAYFDSSKSPMSIDENIYRATLTRTPEPTEDQIRTVESKAMDMLQKMELGEWEIDRCKVRTLGETVLEHVICIDAVPVINNVAAIRQPQLTELTSSDTDSSNYYMTEASFEFSANGDLIKFTMYSPVDVKQVVNQNVTTIDMNTLLDKAKQHLALSDSYQYGLQDIYGVLTERIKTSVDIDKICYGLLREKVPDSDDSFYYLPGIILYGSVENVGVESNQLYYQSAEPFPIIALNAVDGSVVAFTND